ncbi:MAG: hypothetical protein MZU91_01460, partial [Desulfosudis oleivorans]|nr:hypothetical protein [Desulfosudis oleivorans]
ASSPARWAQMLNEILNDQELWNRYQIWLFTYNTGNPILYSGGISHARPAQRGSATRPRGQR